MCQFQSGWMRDNSKTHQNRCQCQQQRGGDGRTWWYEIEAAISKQESIEYTHLYTALPRALVLIRPQDVVLGLLHIHGEVLIQLNCFVSFASGENSGRPQAPLCDGSQELNSAEIGNRVARGSPGVGMRLQRFNVATAVTSDKQRTSGKDGDKGFTPFEQTSVSGVPS